MNSIISSDILDIDTLKKKLTKVPPMANLELSTNPLSPIILALLENITFSPLSDFIVEFSLINILIGI